jgi:hypothetical protein
MAVYKIGIRILVLLFAIFIFSLIYETYFYEQDLIENAPEIQKIRSIPEETELLYLGESSNNTFHKDDQDQRSISAFTFDYFPDIPSHGITRLAAHGEVYYYMLRNIAPQTRENINTVIITLNLRSFGADWMYSNLETVTQKRVLMLKPYPPLLKRFMLSFKAYDVKSKEERHRQVLNAWENNRFAPRDSFTYANTNEWEKAIAGVVKSYENLTPEEEKRILAAHYVKAYAFQIDPETNPRIQDFDDIVAYADQQNWNLVLNLMAENVEKAQQLVGDELTTLMRANTQFLIERYSKKGTIVVNNLQDVTDSLFIDQQWTTEHYTERGRKIIAHTLADSLKSIYPKTYTAPSR